MANEVQVSVGFRASKNGVSATPASGVTLSMTANGIIRQVVIADGSGGSATALTATGLAGNPKVVYIQNLDAANSVVVKLSTNVVSTLPAGAAMVLYPGAAATAISLQSSAVATVLCDVAMCDI